MSNLKGNSMTWSSNIRCILSLIIPLILRIVAITKRKGNWHTTKSFKRYIIQSMITISAPSKMCTDIVTLLIIGSTRTEKPPITTWDMIMTTSHTSTSVTPMSTHRTQYRSKMWIIWRVRKTLQFASLRPMLESLWALQRRILLLTLCLSVKNVTIILIDGVIVTMMNMPPETKTITTMTFLTAAERRVWRIAMRTIIMTTI